MKQINLDHVEQLSRGKRSGAHIGSRAVGHHLKVFERKAYERGLTRGFLEIDERSRANLWHIWEKACAAQDWTNFILVKDTAKDRGDLYRDNTLVESGALSAIKKIARERALLNLQP